MDTALDGKTAIVTGASRGVGRAIARGLARAGAAVAVVARSRSQVEDAAAQIERGGGRSVAWVADVRDPEAVATMVERVERRLGPVDLLVNNAGTGAAIGPLWEVDPEDWWRDIEVALRGAFLCSRAVLPGMIRRGRGRIVNLTSRTGATGVAYLTAYSASRAALFQLTEGLARETQPHGIRVFALTPGLVRTAMTEHMLDSEAGQRWLASFRTLAADGSRWVDPATVGEAVVALASGRADALSGRWIHAQDDLESILGRVEEIEAQDLHVARLRE